MSCCINSGGIWGDMSSQYHSEQPAHNIDIHERTATVPPLAVNPQVPLVVSDDVAG